MTGARGDDRAADEDSDYPDDPGPNPAPGTPPSAAADPGGELVYPNVVAFVEQHLAKVYARDLATPTLRWCPRWWAHPEALDRLDACWRAWENLRKDKTTGPSVWWREHADPAMRELLAETGTFTACSRGHQTRHPVPPLPTEPAGSAVVLQRSPMVTSGGPGRSRSTEATDLGSRADRVRQQDD